MKRVSGAIAMFVAIALFTGGACNGSNNSATKNQHKITGQDVAYINGQVQVLRQAEPFPKLKDSAALRVQASWYTADSDPNKVWYVTVLSFDGSPTLHLTTRGAPQPAGDQVTNPVQQYCATRDSNGPSNCDTIGLQEPNGVHQGTADSAYIAILTTGAIVKIPAPPWSIISDQPLSVKTPVKLSINENAPISATSTTTTDHPIIPTGTSQRGK